MKLQQGENFSKCQPTPFVKKTWVGTNTASPLLVLSIGSFVPYGHDFNAGRDADECAPDHRQESPRQLLQ